MRRIIIYLVVIVLMSSSVFLGYATAQGSILGGQININSGAINVNTPDAPTNFSIQNTNSSDFWDLLDVPTDIPNSEFWYNFSDEAPINFDTNASTACNGSELLFGNGTCQNSTIFFDDTNNINGSSINITNLIVADNATFFKNVTVDGTNAIRFRDPNIFIRSPTFLTLNLEALVITMKGQILSLGTGAATTSSLSFDTSSNDGKITWSGTSDQFQFPDDVRINSNEALTFRGQSNNITSQSTDKLTIASPDLTITATTLFGDGVTTFTNNANFTQTLILDQSELNITNNGSCVVIFGTSSKMSIC